jgi:hypothetical protein
MNAVKTEKSGIGSIFFLGVAAFDTGFCCARAGIAHPASIIAVNAIAFIVRRMVNFLSVISS